MFCAKCLRGTAFSISVAFDQCTVPQGINGPVAIFITFRSQPLVANVVQQATLSLLLALNGFIDTQTDVLGQMIRTVSSGGATSSTRLQRLFHWRCHINYFQCIAASASPQPLVRMLLPSQACRHKYYSDTPPNFLFSPMAMSYQRLVQSVKLTS